MQRTAIPSLVYDTDHADEALSLSEYFNQHGIFAVVEDRKVFIPVEREEILGACSRLYQGWCDFWNYSDKGLWGLPIYEKTVCSHHG